VLPSMSVKRNVTVPAGSGLTLEPVWSLNGFFSTTEMPPMPEQRVPLRSIVAKV